MIEDDDDEMGVAAAFVMGVAIGFVSIAVVSAAVIWNVAELVAKGVSKIRR
jgi:hypothetical protein